MAKTMTMDEVNAIEKAYNQRMWIGGLTIASGFVGIIIMMILPPHVPIMWATFSCLVAIGGGAIIAVSAPSIIECTRCGERYSDRQKHPEDVCLCNLKSKMAKADCK